MKNIKLLAILLCGLTALNVGLSTYSSIRDGEVWTMESTSIAAIGVLALIAGWKMYRSYMATKKPTHPIAFDGQWKLSRRPFVVFFVLLGLLVLVVGKSEEWRTIPFLVVCAVYLSSLLFLTVGFMRIRTKYGAVYDQQPSKQVWIEFFRGRFALVWLASTFAVVCAIVLLSSYSR